MRHTQVISTLLFATSVPCQLVSSGSTSRLLPHMLSTHLTSQSLPQAQHLLQTSSSSRSTPSHTCSAFLPAPLPSSVRPSSARPLRLPWGGEREPQGGSLVPGLARGGKHVAPGGPSVRMYGTAAAGGGALGAADPSMGSSASSQDTEPAVTPKAAAKPHKPRKTKAKEELQEQEQGRPAGPVGAAAEAAGGSSSGSGSGSGRDIAAPFDPASLLRGLPSLSGPWSTPRTWVMFSDLHVHPRTLHTCLQVLREVHQQAARRQAGVLFLGDFWDERGALPVPTLNAVLSELGSWTQPLLMLVGNHDQVDLGGETHALKPLEMAFPDRVHVFSAPALYRGAVWLPYRRDHRVMRAAIQAAVQAAAPGGVSAVFAHADVQTARFNHAVQAREGLPPDLFPAGLPVYSGHYHLPQRVPGTDIVYVGSPYQVTAAEAGEAKRLLVLDAEEGWRVVEEVALQLGPRHMRAGSLQELQRLAEGAPQAGGVAGVRAGDKVKCSVPAGEDAGGYEEVQRRLGALGVRVELVQRAAARAPRIMEAEDKGVLELLGEYARAEGMEAEAEQAARDALGEELVRGGTAGGSEASRHTHVRFERLEMEGFGPFRERQVYSLMEKGVRVITGRNGDDGCAESNGSGKTSLVAAPLWALTGDMLARTESGGGGRLAVDSMLNDASKEGWVRLEGSVNGERFVVERAVRRGKTSRLHFELGGRDMDQQDLRDTQALLNQQFNQQLLRHAVFYGQNDVTALLEADDARFKELLGKVVEMEVWEKAQARVRAERSAVGREAATVEGRLAAWEQQLGPAARALEAAGEQEAAWQEQHAAKVRRLEGELGEVEAEAGALVRGLAGVHRLLERGGEQVLGWAREAEAAVRGLEVAAVGSEEVEAMQVVALPLELQEQQGKGDEGQQGQGQGQAGLGEVDEDWMPGVRERHEQEELVQEQRWREEEEAAEARSREALQAAAAAVAAVEAPLQEARERVFDLKAKLELSAKQLQRARRSKLEQEQAGGHRHSGAGAAAVRGGEGVGGTGLGIAAVLSVQPVCDQCLQEIDPEQFRVKLQGMEAEHEVLEGEYERAMKVVQEREAVWRELRRAQEQEQERGERQAGAAEAERRRRGEELRQRQRGEVERRAEAARAAAAAARAAQQRQRAEAEARLEAALRGYEEAQQRAREEWEARRLEAAARSRERLGALQRVQQHRAILLAAAQRLQDAAQRLLAVRSRSPLAEEQWGLVGGEVGVEGGDAAGSYEEQQRWAERLQSQAVEAVGGVEKADGCLQHLQLLRGQREAARGDENPHARQLQTLVLQLQELQQRVEAEQQRQAQARRRVQMLDQADKALGRGGIPSFVLEGVLGELQTRTDFYLEQLSDTMVLELSATKPASSTTAAAAAPARAKRGAAAAAAAAAADEDGAAVGSSAVSSRTKKGGSDAGSADKEEIHKVVKVKLGSQLLPRSLAQLSGGERRRVALALALGFAELVRSRGRLSSNMLILDEVLQQLDAEGCAKVAMMLKGLPHESVLVVGQAHSFVTRAFDLVDTVVKQNGSSHVEE